MKMQGRLHRCGVRRATRAGVLGACADRRRALHHHAAGALAAAEISIAARHQAACHGAAPATGRAPPRAETPPPIYVPETGRLLPNLPALPGAAPAAPRRDRTGRCAARIRPVSMASRPATARPMSAAVLISEFFPSPREAVGWGLLGLTPLAGARGGAEIKSLPSPAHRKSPRTKRCRRPCCR